ncbi:6648_t:CDS:2 [Diversispora eburnea]|uniref:6648_t:CDS:1 n=1 Tax=Diversispora eburnea TaxID=1213867 RepID=A0A9N8VJX3_9GLOM|nr:6648_t:CDS:2 [Diversispora eburnea]
MLYWVFRTALIFIIVPNDVGVTALPSLPKKKVHEYKFHLSKIELAPDGFTKLVSAVNGQYPGPLIEANKGDRLIIHVENCLGEPTAIHWHGMFQHGTPWFDGVVGQTQYVIPDKCNFTYDFTVDHQSGSYWYHSHHRGQYMDGILGALIIYDDYDKILYGYDEDVIVIITDWYHSNAAELFKWFLSPASKGAEVFEGTKTVPYRINQLPINVAQRYSVLVDANQLISNYWMRIKFQQECLPDEFAYNLTIDNKAIIHYEEASHEHPTTSPWTDKIEECIDLDQNKLKPLVPCPPKKCDKRLVYIVEFEEDSNGVNRPFVNGSSYVSDDEYPTLKKVFDGVTVFEKSENIYQLHKKDKDDGEHPFHLHGHAFWILGWGKKDEKLEYDKLNTINPIQRDTTTMPADGWIVLRFVADNPGIWACHCHMEWHLGAGLLVQFVELPEIIKTLNPPKSWYDLSPK